MGLDPEDFGLFKEIKQELNKHNSLLEHQNDILIEILQQMKYNR